MGHAGWWIAPSSEWPYKPLNQPSMKSGWSKKFVHWQSNYSWRDQLCAVQLALLAVPDTVHAQSALSGVIYLPTMTSAMAKITRVMISQFSFEHSDLLFSQQKFPYRSPLFKWNNALKMSVLSYSQQFFPLENWHLEQKPDSELSMVPFSHAPKCKSKPQKNQHTYGTLTCSPWTIANENLLIGR